MKWLIDEMLPRAAADELRARGHDAVAVADVDLQGAADVVLFDRAVAEQRVMVTENFADFAALLEQRQVVGEPCTPIVFVRKPAFPPGGALPIRLAEILDDWASKNSDPYHGLHWH